MTPTDIIVAPIFNANFISSFKFEIILFNTESDFKKFEIAVFQASLKMLFFLFSKPSSSIFKFSLKYVFGIFDNGYILAVIAVAINVTTKHTPKYKFQYSIKLRVFNIIIINVAETTVIFYSIYSPQFLFIQKNVMQNSQANLASR